MRKLACYLLWAFMWLDSSAQYFNNRYTLGSNETYFNNIINIDSSLYICGVVTPHDSIYQGKLAVSRFDFNGSPLQIQYYELDSFFSYQPSNHTFQLFNNSINLCGGFGVNGFSTTCFSANISPSTLGLTLHAYADTSMMNFFLMGGVELPSGNRVYLGGYQNRQYYVSYCIFKTDSAGNELWRKYYPLMPDWQEPSVITSLKNGHLLIGSQRGNYIEGTAYSSYTQLIEIDTFGNTIKYWEDDYDSAAGRAFSPAGIVELSNTDRIYAANYLDTCLVYPSQFSTYALERGYIVRIDTSGHKVWELKVGTSSPVTMFYQMKQLSDGNFLVVGQNVDSIDNPGNPFQCGWLVKFTAQGQILWQRTYYYTMYYNYLYDFIELNNGDIMACGQCIDLRASVNSQQGWLLHLDSNGCVIPGECFTGVTEITQGAIINIYPNPASDQINIQVQKDNLNEVSYSLMNIEGQVVCHNSSDHLSHSYINTLNISTLPVGIYMIEVIVDGERITKKVLKE